MTRASLRGRIHAGVVNFNESILRKLSTSHPLSGLKGTNMKKSKKDTVHNIVATTYAVEGYWASKTEKLPISESGGSKQPPINQGNRPQHRPESGRTEVKPMWINPTDQKLVAGLTAVAVPKILNAKGAIAAIESNLSVALAEVHPILGVRNVKAVALALEINTGYYEANRLQQFRIELSPVAGLILDRMTWIREIALSKQVLQAKRIHSPARFAMKLDSEDLETKKLLEKHGWLPVEPEFGFVVAREEFGLSFDQNAECFYFFDHVD